MKLLNLYLPTQLHSADTSQLATNPDNLHEWLADLPLTNVEKASEQLLAYLRQINQTDFSVFNRFSYLCPIRTTVEDLIELLRPSYQLASLPYKKSIQYKFELGINLINELARGFRIITKSCTEIQSKQKSEPLRNLVLTTIYLTIEQFGHLLLEYYSAYLPVPKQVWQMIHLNYEYAESTKLHELAVPSCSKQHKIFTINYIYKSVLVQSIINPYQLMRGESTLMQQIIAEVAGRCPLKRLENSNTNAEYYFINYRHDSAPKLYLDNNSNNSAYIRLLDINPFMNHVEKLAREIVDDSSNHYGKQQSLDLINTAANEHQPCKVNNMHSVTPILRLDKRLKRDMLQRILHTLNRHSEREHSRNPAVGKLNMTFGLSASHFHLSNESCFNPELDEIRLNTGTLKPNSSKLSLIPRNIEHWKPELSQSSETSQQQSRSSIFDDQSDALDTWKKIYSKPNFDGFEQRNLSELKRYHASTHWKHKNISAGGMCVFCHPEQALAVNVGDLIAYHSIKEKTWWIGIVRWLRIHDHSTIEIGLMHLHHSATAVAVRAIKGTGCGSEYFRSLLTEENISDTNNTLIVPAAIYDIGTELLINMGHRLVYVRLTELLLSSKSISQFSFTIIAMPESEQESLIQLKLLLN